jgi:1,2-phenylacetyl-CoA epoxidase catalytic subunit
MVRIARYPARQRIRSERGRNDVQVPGLFAKFWLDEMATEAPGMNMSNSVSDALKSELLCIADSNWILGHWYCNCMLNGRELTDFTSMAGIAEDKLGHTRALFSFMEEYFDLPEFQLEFGRDATEINSMQLLDAPPQNWGDFVLTLYLADAAIWRFSNTLREGRFAPVANLVTKFGEEAYFHQLCIDGWLKALDDTEKNDLLSALPARLPLAVSWLQESASDHLLVAGIRTQAIAEARASLTELVLNKLGSIIEFSSDQLEALLTAGQTGDWDDRRRRPAASVMPPRLWESVVPTSEAAQIARRPLTVSIDDNIDLFVSAKKDETEPTF